MLFESLDFSDQRALRDVLRKIRDEIIEDDEKKRRSDVIVSDFKIATDDPDLTNEDSPEVETHIPLRSGWYTRLSDYKVLNREEQMSLGKRIEAGLRAQELLATIESSPSRRRDQLERVARDGKSAQEKLVLHNLRLVRSLAFAYSRKKPQLDLDDAFQSGVLGVMHAAEKFDWRRGYTFSTYANAWIRQAMQRDWMNLAPLIHIPIYTWQSFVAPRGALETWTLKSDVESTPELRAALSILQGIDDFEEYSECDREDALVLLQRLLGIAPYTLENQFDESAMHKAILGLIRGLPIRERRIVIKYFGVGQDQPMTLEEIGKIYSLTRERVRQILARSLSMLRHPEGEQSHIWLRSDFID